MALYRTIPGPPKETAFTDEQLERYLAEVRRDTLLEAAIAVCVRCKNGDKLKCIRYKYYLHVIDVEGTNDTVDVNCDAEEIHQLITAEQGQGEESK